MKVTRAAASKVGRRQAQERDRRGVIDIDHLTAEGEVAFRLGLIEHGPLREDHASQRAVLAGGAGGEESGMTVEVGSIVGRRTRIGT